MKKIILALIFALSFSVFADEVPVPAKVVMFNYPTLNGSPFAAVFAHDYYTDAQVGGVNITEMATNSARLICLFLGYDRAYNYALEKVAEEKTNVLFVNQYLIAGLVETQGMGEFRTTVFSKLGCFNNNTRP